jgi:hypothetical protein
VIIIKQRNGSSPFRRAIANRPSEENGITVAAKKPAINSPKYPSSSNSIRSKSK